MWEEDGRDGGGRIKEKEAAEGVAVESRKKKKKKKETGMRPNAGGRINVSEL